MKVAASPRSVGPKAGNHPPAGASASRRRCALRCLAREQSAQRAPCRPDGMGCYAGDQTSAPQSVDTIEGRGHDEDRCPEEPATNGERLPQTFSDMPDTATTLFGRAASAIPTTANRVPQPDNSRSENRATAFQNQANRDLGSRNTNGGKALTCGNDSNMEFRARPTRADAGRFCGAKLGVNAIFHRLTLVGG